MKILANVGIVIFIVVELSSPTTSVELNTHRRWGRRWIQCRNDSPENMNECPLKINGLEDGCPIEMAQI